MGWTYTRKEKGVSVKEFFINEFNGEHIEVLDVAVIKLKTAYMAIKDLRTSQIFGCVCLLDYSKEEYYNFGYKEMEESVMPYYFDCPERILKRLSPTTDKNANKWRDECWNIIKKKKSLPKLKDGMIIKFENPIEFTDGRTLQKFQVMKEGRKTAFKNGYDYYKISNWRDREFQVVEN